MGMLSLTSPVFVAAVMFDKDTTATIQNFSLDGSSFPSEPFPCKANTPYAFNCDEVLLGTASVTVAIMITPKVAHGVPLGIFTTDICLLVE